MNVLLTSTRQLVDIRTHARIEDSLYKENNEKVFLKIEQTLHIFLIPRPISPPRRKGSCIKKAAVGIKPQKSGPVTGVTCVVRDKFP